MPPGTPPSFLWLFFPSQASHLLPSGQVFLPVTLSLVWFSHTSAQNYHFPKHFLHPLSHFIKEALWLCWWSPARWLGLQIVIQKTKKKKRKRTFYSCHPNPCPTLLFRVFKNNFCVNHHNPFLRNQFPSFSLSSFRSILSVYSSEKSLWCHPSAYYGSSSSAG